MLFFLDILKAHGRELPQGARILDLGGRLGGFVNELRETGYDAHGCDVQILPDELLVDPSLMKQIQMEPYKLPFEDNSFDAVFSNQVFEHVQNYFETLEELHRVMKPGAVMLHVFPTRYSPIEPHILIPFGCLFHPDWYLKLCAYLGFRNNKYQKGHSREAVYQRFKEFYATQVNYLSKKEIRAHFSRRFQNFAFLKRTILQYGTYGHIAKLRPLLLAIPFSGALYSFFGNQVVFAEKAKT